jgi:chromosome segregation ATPase
MSERKTPQELAAEVWAAIEADENAALAPNAVAMMHVAAALSASEARAADLDRKLTTAMGAGVAMSEAHETALARAAASEARAKAAEEHSRGLASALQIMGEENAKIERERDEWRDQAEDDQRDAKRDRELLATAEARREEAEREYAKGQFKWEGTLRALAANIEQRKAAEAERDEARRALRGLVTRLDEVHASPEYRGVWELSFLRNGAYRGPTYTEALDAARALSGAGAEEGR